MVFLGLGTEFWVFAGLFAVLNVVFDFFSKKMLRIDGVDFLFFAPWLAAIRLNSIPAGLIMTAIILLLHSSFHPGIAKYIFLSFPAQVVAVLMGYFFGLEMFWWAMIVYYVISTAITGLLGGIGGRYFLFMLANLLTNIAAFFAYTALV